MIIRKLFRFEGSHVVRDCTSKRCSTSIHGHSYIVEIFLESNKLDNGGMVVDFGLLKGTVKDFVDSFDHAYSMWTKEDKEFKDFMVNNSERWVEMPVTPSAEMYSLMFYAVIKHILDQTEFNNGEKEVRLHSVRVHETATGYAEADYNDWLLLWLPNYKLSDIKISQAIKDEWKDPEMWGKILSLEPGKKFFNPKVELKYNK